MTFDHRRSHWDEAYLRSGATAVSWFQPEPTVSLELIDGLDLRPNDPIIDIGGGASRLVDALLDRRFTDVSVMDVSEAALGEARARLRGRATAVTWWNEDLLAWRPSRRYVLWHDRAMFHFLVDPVERERYVDALRAGLASNGVVVMATFASDGPQHCSGLPVARYDADELAAAIGATEVVVTKREEHSTPGGGVQPFTWIVAR